MEKKTSGNAKTTGRRTAKNAHTDSPAALGAEIRDQAFFNFTERTNSGAPGDELSDWLKAEADVKRRHGLA